ncbi:hypothetical protein SARC_10223 [Sphaeroforma arctica JP610]|uniref:NAD(P)-binding domain-containing protein n=1 Tax=Sphaeroforma arctica JP610 TaxID=667725 RepID=A0A0L0FKM1_9EUKA|nr:hypothetical protein SARC_10223 [Sphaeroforma arctica JP610]KNC77315.1 hypothetical protein SARC_10223 [Sphaeroforma arctica JP610]|eukprot:XP_014151217.1 hypothetical protein SARC_10223 [Sphaeroforma arctica JP610]
MLFLTLLKVRRFDCAEDNPDKDVLKRAFSQGSCLYIVIGAGAPSKIRKEDLYEIDVTIPSALANEARVNGIRALTLLGSTGPDINATYSAWTGTIAGGGYYRHCKGQVEENIKQLNFESTNLMRPACLLGNTNTPKLAEIAIKAFNFITPVKLQGIEVTTLAQKMIKATNL